MAKATNNHDGHSDLEAQQAQADAMFNSIGDGVISTDEFGRITRVNPVGQQLLGYSEAELLGEWFPKKIIAVGDENQPINLIDRPITKAFLTGKPVSGKMYYQTKSGQRLPVAINTSPMLLDGKPIGAIEVFRDSSVEDEIDRMKSEFISLASHQLRTPLTAIKTYTHMLVDGYMGDVSPAQRKALRTIISSANRMNELISTLLNITRIESGTITVTPKQVRVERLTEEVIREVSLAATDKQINLSLKLLGSQTTQVTTDTLILKEIIANLITNAIKYTPEQGAVVVSISGRKHDVVLIVKDSGWGIPKSSHDQIFSKFFRAQNVVQRETTGTGLGLYLVKGLIDQLGGTIRFESEEGKGTTFFVTIPRMYVKPEPPRMFNELEMG